MNSSRKEKSSGGCYVVTAASAFVVVAILEKFWPDIIPFRLLEFWRLDAPVAQILLASWPLFAWGIGRNAFILFTSRNDRRINRNAERVLGEGLLISLWAGVVEEIAFRWLFFYDQIYFYKAVNWLLFGFAGHGLLEWTYLHLIGPIANFLTLGMLHPILFNGLGWAVGAALISSNGKFQNGHSYQGLIGWVTTWFIGMFMFYLMFQYGLLAAIIVHFLYDLFIFGLLYVDAVAERALGWT